MKNIILFRYHIKPKVCVNRLKLLKRFNPHTNIYGLYGGLEQNHTKISKILKSYLEHSYCIQNKSKKWKWLHSDLSTNLWFRNYGKTLIFDRLYLIEWDLLLFDSLNNIYKHIPLEGIALTGLTDLKNVKSKWSWTNKEPYSQKWNELVEKVKKKYNYNQTLKASLGPGPCFPKKFLQKYSEMKLPETVNDELRLPLYTQILDFKLYDTGFYKKWFDTKEKKLFNCRKNMELSLANIEKELAKPNGRKVFHPYRKIFNINSSGKLIP